jgi:hypothetical protein
MELEWWQLEPAALGETEPSAASIEAASPGMWPLASWARKILCEFEQRRRTSLLAMKNNSFLALGVISQLAVTLRRL